MAREFTAPDSFNFESGASAELQTTAKRNVNRKAKLAAITASICGVVVLGYCVLATGEHRSQAVITSQFDMGCVANHLGARPKDLGSVKDCEVTKERMSYGLDQLFLKFAYARPAAMMKPAGMRGAVSPQMQASPFIAAKGNAFASAFNFVPSQMIPVRARTGNVLMALSDDEAGQARKFFIGGNWKATGTPDSVKSLVKDLNEAKVEVDTKSVEVVCAPPFLYLSQVKDTLREDYSVAAQNMWDKAPGAWTGETPAEMLTGMGVGWVILGHSERRENCGETDKVVADKTKFAIDAGLSTITCIGEKLDAREGGTTFEVLDEQMKPLAAALSEEEWDKVVLAYEPVWAIGTGKTATPEQAEETHAYLRKWLKDNVSDKVSKSVRILYGGSVKPANSDELATKPNIDGFLVGGASLDGGDFTKIINSGKNQK
jgi:triosephosphate isomerase